MAPVIALLIVGSRSEGIEAEVCLLGADYPIVAAPLWLSATSPNRVRPVPMRQ